MGEGGLWGLVYFSPWDGTVNGFVNDPHTLVLILILNFIKNITILDSDFLMLTKIMVFRLGKKLNLSGNTPWEYLEAKRNLHLFRHKLGTS